MSDFDFKQKLENYCSLTEKMLHEYLSVDEKYPSGIYEAMRYSVMQGGKRLRPALMMAACEMFDGTAEDVGCLACAIEMIHTYSLIHDDLPSMDNDDLRRGKPTNHKVFGEATAILAGDGLLNKAFEIVLNCENKNERHIEGLRMLANASGSSGMVGGQMLDISGVDNDQRQLEHMYQLKTGALIQAAVTIGGLIGGATDRQIRFLKNYGGEISLAFQIKDDILDIEGEQSVTGKASGSDAANKKNTLVSFLGIKRSKQYLDILLTSAINSVKIFEEKAWFLNEMANFIINREC